jgi:hypothetical protein
MHLDVQTLSMMPKSHFSPACPPPRLNQTLISLDLHLGVVLVCDLVRRFFSAMGQTFNFLWQKGKRGQKRQKKKFKVKRNEKIEVAREKAQRRMDEEPAHDRSPELGGEEQKQTTTPRLQEGEEEEVENVGACTATPPNLSTCSLDKSTQKLARELSRPFIVQWYVFSSSSRHLHSARGRTDL